MFSIQNRRDILATRVARQQRLQIGERRRHIRASTLVVRLDRDQRARRVSRIALSSLCRQHQRRAITRSVSSVKITSPGSGCAGCASPSSLSVV